MSVVPMKLLTIAGPLEQFDDVVSACVLDQEFHPEYTLHMMEGVSNLRPFPLSNAYAPLLRRAQEVLGELGLQPAYAPFEGEEDLEKLSGYFDRLEQTVKELEDRRATQRRLLEEDRSVSQELSHLQGLSTDLEHLQNMKYARFRYGYLPRDTYDSFQSTLNDDADLFFFPTMLETRRVYGVYFTTKEAHERVDSLFNSLHFVRIQLDATVHGTPEEAIGTLTKLATKAEEKLAALDREQAEFAQKEAPHLHQVYSWLRYHSARYDLRRYAARSRETFYLMGWVPR